MAEKKPDQDFDQEAMFWKKHVKVEEMSVRIWRHRWGWLLNEYQNLKDQLDKKAEKSTLLIAIKEKVKEDKRQLSKYPKSTNHIYGWVSKEPDFKLERYGPDCFKPLKLPDDYSVTK